MKRILLLVAGLILSGSMVLGQNIEIIRSGGNHSVNDSTITVNGSLPTAAFIISFDVINTGGASLSIKAKWYRLSGVKGAHTPANAICWGACYPQDTNRAWTAPSTQVLASGDTNKTFTGYYYDSTNAGTESIYYIFYNSANPNDSAWVLINYNIAPMGIAQINSNALHVSAAYPNPANSRVTFNYNLKSEGQGTLEIYNSIGRCVQTLPMNRDANKLSIDVSSLPSGIYICKLYADGCEPVYQRLIVAH